MLKLRDIMTTDVVTVTPETSLREAMDVLAAQHVSGAPVVSGGRVVGVISATDLLSFVASTPAPPEYAKSSAWAESDEVEHKVSDAMAHSPITLPPDADITAAAELMRQKGMHRVLVMSDDNLVGIVSALDIARAVADHKVETRRYVFTKPAAPSHRRWP